MSYKKSFAQVLGAFIGRTLGSIVINLIKAVINATVLGFLVKWIWNYLIQIGVLDFIFISYPDAFLIILLARFIFGRPINERRLSDEEKEVG